MNVSKIKKKIENLKKIKEIIEISKFDTLHKIQKAKKITETYFDIALLSKDLIDHAANKFFIKGDLNKSPRKEKAKPILWIMATIKSTLMSTSYDVQEKMLKKYFNSEKDILIVIGEPAIDFAKKQEWRIYYQLHDINEAVHKLPVIVSSMYAENNLNAVKFISNSVYAGQDPITILPLNKLNLNYQTNKNNIQGYKFVPSINQTVNYLNNIYIERLIKGLLRETKYIYLKEKLIRHENSKKTVEERIDENIAFMNKENRKNETEELIHITQIAKRGNNE